MSDIKYKWNFEKYVSIKNITLGFMIGSKQNFVYGLLGRNWFIELNLIFIHLKLELIRLGHGRK